MANRMPISDCDETYNYWEPLHFLLYGSGLQTWEYAHEYALRTYAYLLPLKAVAVLMQPFLAWAPLLTDAPVVANDKVALFLLLRSFLAALTATAEVTWLKTLQESNKRTPVVWIAALLGTSVGMNHAAGAYLPSATFATTWLFASACFLTQHHCMFIMIAVLATLATGWPFGAIVLMPMGAAILWKERQAGRLISILAFIVLITVYVQGVVLLIDHHYYGKWVSPTLNIFLYNAAGGGDELYGVEPASYYVRNLVLNLHMAVPFAIFALPVLYFTYNRDWNTLVMVSSLYVWLAATVPRPHKEERFLVPIYPVVCMAAVMTADSLWNAFGRVLAGLSRHKELSVKQRTKLHAMVWVPAILLSLCRVAALRRYYTAPLSIYAQVAALKEPGSRVCTCGEWYRYPGSFYIPDDMSFGFLPSSFGGQLPQQFTAHGSKKESMEELNPFNDRNIQIEDTFAQRQDCQWIVGLEGSECTDDWAVDVVASAPMIDAAKTSFLHRVLYIPLLHEQAMSSGKATYMNLMLYKVQ